MELSYRVKYHEECIRVRAGITYRVMNCHKPFLTLNLAVFMEGMEDDKSLMVTLNTPIGHSPWVVIVNVPLPPLTTKLPELCAPETVLAEI